MLRSTLRPGSARCRGFLSSPGNLFNANELASPPLYRDFTYPVNDTLWSKMSQPNRVKDALSKMSQGMTKLSLRKAMALASEAPPRPVLPIDIWEEVIDSVARRGTSRKKWSADAVRSTLHACSLTCRAWTPRSQYRLFQFLVLKFEAYGIVGLSSLLEKYPTLPARVEVLVIKRVVDDDQDDFPQLKGIPLEVSSLFRAVPELRLSACSIMNVRQLRPALLQFTTLTTLKISKVMFMVAIGMCLVLSNFPKLQTLHMSSPWWVRVPEVIPEPPNNTLWGAHLRELFINADAEWAQDSRGVAFLEWLGRSGVVTRVQNLQLQGTMALEAATRNGLLAMIQAATNTLQVLSLNPCPELNRTELSDTLRRCDTLTSVTFILDFDKHAFRHLLSFLAQGYFPPDLYIRFEEPEFMRQWNELAPPDPPPPRDWGLLDDLLDDRRGLAPYNVYITRVEIGPDWYHIVPMSESLATTLFSLPKLRRRGIVQYHASKEEGYKSL